MSQTELLREIDLASIEVAVKEAELQEAEDKLHNLTGQLEVSWNRRFIEAA